MYGEYVWLICEYHQAIGRCQRPSEFKKICWPEAAICWCWNCWWVETLKPTSWTEPKSKKNYKKHQKDQHFVSFYCMGVSGMSRLSRKKHSIPIASSKQEFSARHWDSLGFPGLRLIASDGLLMFLANLMIGPPMATVTGQGPYSRLVSLPSHICIRKSTHSCCAHLVSKCW
jgi:hypothetical protein